METLSERGVHASGTAKDNRTGDAKRHLIASIIMKTKSARESFEYCCNVNVFVTKYFDNVVVNVASNLHHALSVKRCVKDNPQVAVTQPHVVKRNNEGMGEVDLMNRLLTAYIRGKKWW